MLFFDVKNRGMYNFFLFCICFAIFVSWRRRVGKFAMNQTHIKYVLLVLILSWASITNGIEQQQQNQQQNQQQQSNSNRSDVKKRVFNLTSGFFYSSPVRVINRVVDTLIGVPYGESPKLFEKPIPYRWVYFLLINYSDIFESCIYN